MAKGLNDKNYKGVLGDIKNKGFTAKFWQDHRSFVAQGCGVAKAMNHLKKLGVTASGDFKKVDYDDLDEVIKGFEDLDKALSKAQGRAHKAGKPVRHTYELCYKYGEVISDIRVELKNYKSGLDKKYASAKQKNLDDQAKQLEQHNKQRDKERDVVFKQMAELDKRARGITKACDQMVADLAPAAKDVTKLHDGFKTQIGSDGRVDPKIVDKFKKGLEATQKKYNITSHGNNIDKLVPKMFNDVASGFKKYIKIEWAKEERISLGASLREAEDALKKAKKVWAVYKERHKDFALEMQATQKQGA